MSEDGSVYNSICYSWLFGSVGSGICPASCHLISSTDRSLSNDSCLGRTCTFTSGEECECGDDCNDFHMFVGCVYRRTAASNAISPKLMPEDFSAGGFVDVGGFGITTGNFGIAGDSVLQKLLSGTAA